MLDERTGEVLTASVADACRAMTKLGSLRKQQVYLVDRLGQFRIACVTLRVRKQRAEREVQRLRDENADLRRQLAEVSEVAERAFKSAMRNAVALAEQRKAGE